MVSLGIMESPVEYHHCIKFSLTYSRDPVEGQC